MTGLMAPWYACERRVSWEHAEHVSDTKHSRVGTLRASFWIGAAGMQQRLALFRPAAAAGLA